MFQPHEPSAIGNVFDLTGAHREAQKKALAEEISGAGEVEKLKLGLEALRSANDAELNREAVEVTVVDSNGYRVLDRAEVNKQIDRLKPLDD